MAHQWQGGTASIEGDCERSSDQKGDFWTLKLRFSPATNNVNNSISFNGLSSDEVAQKKANWLLLGQKTETATTPNIWGSSDRFLDLHIYSGAANTPILPALWKQLKGNAAAFKEAAKLHAVHRLLADGICTEITKLDLGTVVKGKVSINFQGRRASPYRGQTPVEIVVKGSCSLEN